MRVFLLASIAFATLASALPKGHCGPKGYCPPTEVNKLGFFYATDDTENPERVGEIIRNSDKKKYPGYGPTYCTNMNEGTTANAMRAVSTIRCVFYTEKDCPDDKFIGNTDGLPGTYTRYANGGYDSNPNKWQPQKLDGTALSARCFS